MGRCLFELAQEPLRVALAWHTAGRSAPFGVTLWDESSMGKRLDRAQHKQLMVGARRRERHARACQAQAATGYPQIEAETGKPKQFSAKGARTILSAIIAPAGASV